MYLGISQIQSKNKNQCMDTGQWTQHLALNTQEGIRAQKRQAHGHQEKVSTCMTPDVPLVPWVLYGVQVQSPAWAFVTCNKNVKQQNCKYIYSCKAYLTLSNWDRLCFQSETSLYYSIPYNNLLQITTEERVKAQPTQAQGYDKNSKIQILFLKL